MDSNQDSIKKIKLIQNFITSSSFTKPLNDYLQEYCIVFDSKEDIKYIYKVIHQEFKQLLEKLLSLMLEKLGATNDHLIYALKNKNCTNGTLFDLVVASDNLNAFVNIMCMLHKVSIAGIIPQGANAAFNTKKSKEKKKKEKEQVKSEAEQEIKPIEKEPIAKETPITVPNEPLAEIKPKEKVEKLDSKMEVGKDEFLNSMDNLNKEIISNKPDSEIRELTDIVSEKQKSNEIAEFSEKSDIKTVDKKPAMTKMKLKDKTQESQPKSQTEQPKSLNTLSDLPSIVPKGTLSFDDDDEDLEVNLNVLPALSNFSKPQPQQESFMEQMRRLDELKQDKIANLVEKKLEQPTGMSDQELSELKKDLLPLGGQSNKMDPGKKQRSQIEEIKNLINMNKKRKEDDNTAEDREGKKMEEELERRKQHFNQIKTKLKTNVNNFINTNRVESKE